MKAINQMTDNELLRAAEQHRIGMGEGFNPYEVAYENRMNADIKAQKAAWLSEWTKDVTISRRANWNALSRKHNPGRKLTKTEMMEFYATLERLAGHTASELKQAVAHYHL